MSNPRAYMHNFQGVMPQKVIAYVVGSIIGTDHPILEEAPYVAASDRTDNPLKAAHDLEAQVKQYAEVYPDGIRWDDDNWGFRAVDAAGTVVAHYRIFEVK